MRTKDHTNNFHMSTCGIRTLMFPLSLMCMLTFATAQTTVSVGSGTGNAGFVPVRTGQHYSYCQMIYFPVNVGNSGSITKVRFWYNAGATPENSNNWGLYMGHTDQSSFTTNASSFIPLDQLTQVFNGEVSYPGVGNWLEVTLATPFLYNGTQNLVIAVDENTPGSSAGLSWGVFSVGSPSRAIGGQSDDDIDPAAPIRSFNDNSIPRLQLVFAPVSDVTLELRTPDGSSDDVGWEIVSTNEQVLCEGEAYPPDIEDPFTFFCSLPDGCYRLRIFDTGGDGFGVGGGYQLRREGADPTDIRIIDNLLNFTNTTPNGTLSAIGNGPSTFCFPMSTGPKPVYHQRDKLDFVNGSYLVCEEDALVSAEWQVGGQTDDGYEFWLFDPNGSYSYRRFRNHANSDGFANVGAARACHMKVNGWFASQHAPANVLLNVRIRTRVNGVNSPFGPAYRFKIDPTRAACPLTMLNDYPGDQNESCGKTRTWGSGNWIWARPVPGANRYQWRFRTSEFEVIRTTNTYYLQLNWAVDPLVPGETYDVDVRASKTTGATWCTDLDPNVLDAIYVDQWGQLCTVTISGSMAQGGGANLALVAASANLSLFPNPNRGDQVWLSLDAVDEDVETISVDFFDLAGHRVVARTIPAQGTNVNSVLELNGLTAGVYIVHITAGGKRYTERLVVAQ